MDIIAARVRSLREYKEWSQEDLANASGLQRPHISLIENSERIPGADTLVKLSTALQTSTDFLLGLTNDPSPRPSVDPPLDDPDFQRITECYLAGNADARRTVVDVFERMVGLPPTRPVLPRTPEEYELPPGHEEPDDD